ncbi:hypothetical protein NEISUBOT_05392 [Neisseria subflava NJ9703]|uniref:Uncharacterized protein n=1 Tax=Neisseria subflava NJ9703 TaxID=546268 RepID=A0A9W5IPE0_NEISU|nr:hypothetical protein NEISUBOT_05392 [Neisseria subflava NJ9703]
MFCLSLILFKSLFYINSSKILTQKLILSTYTIINIGINQILSQKLKNILTPPLYSDRNSPHLS